MSTPIPDPREPRLPKWAQSELSLLRMRVRAAENRYADLRRMVAGDVPDADTFVDEITTSDDGYPLPVGVRVRFVLNDGEPTARAVRAYVHHDPWRGRRLYLSGDVALKVLPRAGNVVMIEMDGR